MNYNFFIQAEPKMPTLRKGTECIKLLLSQTSKDMHSPLAPMIPAILASHISGTEFQYPDNSWKETCGMMAHLVADSGGNKGQLSYLVEAICRKLREHDDIERKKLIKWKKQVETKSANKNKPERPDVSFLIPPANMTNPAFIQNAMACETQGGRTQYINMPEVEMANGMCGGHKQVSQMIRNIYDRQRAGALRATADGVTGDPLLRVNITISSTPIAARAFYKHELFNGTFGRMVFSYKPRGDRSGRIPRIGKFDNSFYSQLDEYIERLESCSGRHVIKPLNKLADSLSAEMASNSDLADDDVIWDISKRSIVSGWKAGCVLWVLNNQEWTNGIGDFVKWFTYHDIWSKLQIFADMLKIDAEPASQAQRHGPKNLLDDLPDSFNETQLKAVRARIGKTEEGANGQLRKWLHRKFVTYSPQTGLYTKTNEYLKNTSKH